MTEDEAIKHFKHSQEISYENGKVTVYFDLDQDDGLPCMSADTVVFFNSADVTPLMDFDRIDAKIDWAKVEADDE